MPYTGILLSKRIPDQNLRSLNYILNSFRCLLLVYALFSMGTVFGQSKAKFRVISSVTTQGLPYVSVMILHAKDSMLYDAYITNKEGDFVCSIPDSGTYLIVLTHPNYFEFIISINMHDQNLPNSPFILTAKSRLIEEITVVGDRAVVVKGDTLVFNPNSFIIGKNSNVEDLLKQLPGFSIDHHGKISISGRKIAKLLVDGEEFFGDDPLLATRNLKGFMLDKILTYNLNNTNLSFDDQERKVVDLKIKESYKNGYFGKLSAGLGMHAQQQQAMVNIFKKKMKLSAFVQQSNTEKVGLSWADSDKFSTTAQRSELSFLANLVTADLKEAVAISNEGVFDGKGQPKSIYAGTHYNNTWNADKHTLLLNYKINRLNTVGLQSNTTKQVLQRRDQISAEEIAFDNINSLHLFSGNYRMKLDSSLTMSILLDGLAEDVNTMNSSTRSVAEDGKLISQYNRDYLERAHVHQIRFANFWEKKLSMNNLLSLQLNYLNDGSDQKGRLRFKPMVMDRATDFESQDILGSYTGQYYNAKLFAQHKSNNLVGRLFYELTGFAGNYQLFSKQFIDLAEGLLDSLSSGLFTSHQLSNKVSGEIQLSIRKRYIFKSTLNYLVLRQTVHDKFKGYERVNNWNRLAGSASWNYQISKRGRVTILYNLNPVFPTSLEQQRIPYNIDPLNRYVGNLGLEPAQAQSIALLSNIFKEKNLESFSAQLKVRKISHPIIQSVMVGENGQLLTSFVNDLNANWISSVDASYTRKLNGLGITMGLTPAWLHVETNSLVNADLISSRSKNLSFQASVDKYTSKYNLYMRIRPFKDSFKTQGSPNSVSWGFQGSYGCNLYLPKSFTFSTDAVYRFRSTNDFIGRDFKQMIINFEFSKSFLTNENLTFRVGLKDLLNKRSGIDRFALANKYVETRYSTVGRYLMGTVSWDFTKMKTPKL